MAEGLGNPIAIQSFSSDDSNTKDVIVPIGSISKSFFAMAVALFAVEHSELFINRGGRELDVSLKELLRLRRTQLIDRDRLTLLQSDKIKKINKLLNFFETNPEIGDIKLKDIINHTSGITISGLNKNYSAFKRLITFNGDASVNNDLIAEIGDWSDNLDCITIGNIGYSNFAYSFAGEFMGLMTDRNDFMEEISYRVLTPLNIKDSIIPFALVPEAQRSTFGRYYKMSGDSLFVDSERVCYDGESGCSVYNGALCARMSALRLYAEQLAMLYSGNVNLFTDSASQETKSIFENTMAENGYSLGLVREEISDMVYSFNHGGNVPPNEARLNVVVDFTDGKIKKTTAKAFVNEPHLFAIIHRFHDSGVEIDDLAMRELIFARYKKTGSNELDTRKIENDFSKNSLKSICDEFYQEYITIKKIKSGENLTQLERLNHQRFAKSAVMECGMK